MTREELSIQLSTVVAELLGELKIRQLNQREQRDLVTLMLNDMLGLGPLEMLLADDTVNDILVNWRQGTSTWSGRASSSARTSPSATTPT